MMRSKNGQNVAEYIIIMSVVVVAIIATGFIGRITNSLRTYFGRASASMTN